MKRKPKRKLTKLEQRILKAKNLAKGKETRKKLSEEERREQIKVQKMAYAYEEALAAYKGKPTLKYIKKVLTKNDQPQYSLWLRAAYFAEELGCSYETYIRAQFFWFDKWYGKAPNPQACATYKTKTPATKRVGEYLSYLKNEQIEEKQVVGKVKPTNIPESAKSRYSEQTLRQFMKAYNMSEGEVLKTFASKNKAMLYFDRKWLLNNKTYLKMKEAGEI